ncbi:MAG: peroxiredoxin family protein, partial [bacterium]|nr:peroxiredoxin family protein [bacterium]
MALFLWKKSVQTIVGSLAMFLILPGTHAVAGPDQPLSSLPPASEALVDPVDPGRWAGKSRRELQGDYDQMARDLDLMGKRLDKLRGTTRLNQDQYREREILENLVNVKRREMTVVSRLMERGALAPAFSLPGTADRSVSLDQYLGRQPVLVVFYQFDFSPGSTTALTRLKEVTNTLTAHDVAIVAVSGDHPFSQRAFSEKLGLPFPLLSDRTKGVAKAYGVYDEAQDAARPAYFLVDRTGKIVWRQTP